jgi:hypothetical protein
MADAKVPANYTGKNTPTPTKENPYPGSGKPLHPLNERDKEKYAEKQRVKELYEKPVEKPATAAKP